MTRLIWAAAALAATTALLLVQLDPVGRLVAWESLLLLVLVVLVRLIPGTRSEEVDEVPPLFRLRSSDAARLPRSVSKVELAAVHALSEAVGADRRLKATMQRIAAHRLRRVGVSPGSPEAFRMVEHALWAPDDRPLSRAQIERIIDQMERL